MSDLHLHGLTNLAGLYANLPAATLVEQALARREGMLVDSGALVALTGKYTGRCPKDKYFVVEPGSKDQIAWGSVNQPMAPEIFDHLWDKAKSFVQGRELFAFDCYACADPAQRLPVRVITDHAWQSLFTRALLIRPLRVDLARFRPTLTILALPGLQFDPPRDGTRSEVAIALALERGLVLIAGTGYAGEIKKSVFTYLNYWMPQRGVFPMHCAATTGENGTSLLFGLSGTGKTTLSADPERRLIGDDEHGWGDEGVFNFEGGCYAKTIHLSPTGEPLIWDAIRFGAVLENVVVDPLTRKANFDDDRITENTRAAYPIEHIPGAEPTQRGGHAKHIFFLTCDAFGVLPPISKLTPAQVQYHFLSGYTAKVAGTEAGVKEPTATFSTCFAAPFLPLPPTRYAQMLHEKMAKHQAQVWLVNTGWTGGPFGVGRRIPLVYTRLMVKAALGGLLDSVPVDVDPVFGLHVLRSCPDVPQETDDATAHLGQCGGVLTRRRDSWRGCSRKVLRSIGGPLGKK